MTLRAHTNPLLGAVSARLQLLFSSKACPEEHPDVHDQISPTILECLHQELGCVHGSTESPGWVLVSVPLSDKFSRSTSVAVRSCRKSRASSIQTICPSDVTPQFTLSTLNHITHYYALELHNSFTLLDLITNCIMRWMESVVTTP